MDARAIFENFPVPPASALLGWCFQAYDPEQRRIEISFDGKPAFCNPAGVIQGGLLSAMLDDTMGPAVLVASGGSKLCKTVDLHCHFLRPVPVGPIRCTARVLQLGRSIAFIEGELFDQEGRLCLRGQSSAQLADLG